MWIARRERSVFFFDILNLLFNFTYNLDFTVEAPSRPLLYGRLFLKCTYSKKSSTPIGFKLEQNIVLLNGSLWMKIWLIGQIMMGWGRGRGEFWVLYKYYLIRRLITLSVLIKKNVAQYVFDRFFYALVIGYINF